MVALESIKAMFSEASSRLTGSDNAWLSSLRQEQLSAFVQTGFPTKRDEARKYFDTSPLQKNQFHLFALVLSQIVFYFLLILYY